MSRVIVASTLAAVLSFSRSAVADEPAPPPGSQDEAEARRKLEEQIAKDLAGGGARAGSPAQPAAGAGAAGGAGAGGSAQGGQGQGLGGNPMARVLLLPDISAIGSFAGVYDSYDVPGRSPRSGAFGPPEKPTARFEELELGLQSVIDPYARADVFISFTPDGVSVEEAYATTLTLPAGLQVRAGKFFSPFGRLNQQHPHVWDFVDAPLAMNRLLAADVFSGPGVDVAWLAPLPWFAELHLAGQSTQPFEVPGGQERPTAVARLLQYFPLGAATTLGVGVSAARRDEASGGSFADVGGADLYLRYRPAASRAYVTLQGELFGRRFRNVEGGRSDGGGYAQLFWRQGPYYGVGVRYDEAPVGPFFGADPAAAAGTERRYGAVASWYPSEFQRLRLQVSYDTRPDRQDGVEALLGLEFAIGAHGAHPF